MLDGETKKKKKLSGEEKPKERINHWMNERTKGWMRTEEIGIERECSIDE